MHFASRQSDTTDAGLQAVDWVYRKSRQAVTQSLHAMLGIGPSAPMMSVEQILSVIMHGGGIVGHCPELPETRMSGFISALEKTHTEVFFSAPAANEKLLRHLKQFRIWYCQQKKRGRKLPDLIEALSTQPHDWPISDGKEAHFSRIEIPSRKPYEDWRPVVAKWKSSGNWENIDFVLATMSQGFGCDVFYSDRVGAGGMRTLMGNLARHFEYCNHESLSDAEKRYIVSLAQFGINTLGICMQPGYSAALRPGTVAPMAGLAIAAVGMDDVRRHCREYINKIGAFESKAKELRWFLDHCKPILEDNPIFMFLGTLLVYSPESGSNEIGEIDVAWAEFCPNSVVWTFVEVKARGQRGGDGQLRRLSNAFKQMEDPREDKIDTSLSAWISRLEYK